MYPQGIPTLPTPIYTRDYLDKMPFHIPLTFQNIYPFLFFLSVKKPYLLSYKTQLKYCLLAKAQHSLSHWNSLLPLVIVHRAHVGSMAPRWILLIIGLHVGSKWSINLCRLELGWIIAKLCHRKSVLLESLWNAKCGLYCRLSKRTTKQLLYPSVKIFLWKNKIKLKSWLSYKCTVNTCKRTYLIH